MQLPTCPYNVRRIQLRWQGKLTGQRHFGAQYKHEAQASECLMSTPTRSRFVLIFSAIHAKVALSD
jgi:hypothetical protein